MAISQVPAQLAVVRNGQMAKLGAWPLPCLAIGTQVVNSRRNRAFLQWPGP